MEDHLRFASERFGKALAQSSALQGYRRASAEVSADAEAQGLKAMLEEAYDGVIRRQAAGEVLSGGEMDAYFDLEQRVREHTVLAQRDQAYEQVKDFFSEAHWILSGELGAQFIDLLGD